MIETLIKLFNRDLEKLREELSLYKNEANIWIIDKQISNSAGNLSLHLVGNLKTYIGAEFGKTGYVRERENEFSLKGIVRTTLLQQIEETIVVVQSALKLVTEKDLAAEYSQPIWGEPINTGYFLTHLATHLAYHLGQVNYHRRLLDN